MIFNRALRQRPKISIFEGFFRKTRKISDGVLSVLRAKFDAASPKRPKISIFEGFFRKTRKMNDGVLSVLRVKFDAVSPKRPKISIFEGFFRKTRKMNDGVRMHSERNLTQYYGKRLKNQVLISLTISLYVTTTIRSISKIKPMAWT